MPAQLDLGSIDDVPSPDDYHPPHDLPDETLRDLEESARWLHENTPYSVSCGEWITDLQLRPGGREAWWMRLIEEPQGYLFAGVHNIPGDTPEAHLRAILRAYRDCRDLPELTG